MNKARPVIVNYVVHTTAQGDTEPPLRVIIKRSEVHQWQGPANVEEVGRVGGRSATLVTGEQSCFIHFKNFRVH